MRQPFGHLRANVIAYLALFVALGGTSYAAISIPRSSVGTAQLRNGAVTGNKLSKRSIAGSVVFWARIDQNGQVLSSSEPAHTTGWASGNGTIFFRGQLSSKCFALANVTSPPFRQLGFVTTFSSASVAGQEGLAVFMEPEGTTGFGPLPIVIAEICP
jgi:hypothetical protein